MICPNFQDWVKYLKHVVVVRISLLWPKWALQQQTLNKMNLTKKYNKFQRSKLLFSENRKKKKIGHHIFFFSVASQGFCILVVYLCNIDHCGSPYEKALLSVTRLTNCNFGLKKKKIKGSFTGVNSKTRHQIIM